MIIVPMNYEQDYKGLDVSWLRAYSPLSSERQKEAAGSGLIVTMCD